MKIPRYIEKKRYIEKLIRVMSPLSGGDGWTGEYKLETGSRYIAPKRLLVSFKRLANLTIGASLIVTRSMQVN